MTQDFASITELPGTLLSPEQYQRFTHRYAFGLHASGLDVQPVRVLEIGCGAGSGLAAWHAAAEHTGGLAGGLAVGLEYVESSLHLARANLGLSLPLLCGDAQSLPFADASFDTLASFEVIYYLPDLPAFLSEGWRVLAPGGRLILCWSNPEWESFAPGRHSGHYPTLAEVSALLDAAGFAVVELFGAFASEQASVRAQWVNRARRVAVRSGLTSVLGKLTAPLMRAAYGELTPLPARLELAQISTLDTSATPLQVGDDMRPFRVLYAMGRILHLVV